jgi:beta-galactosidase
MLIQEVPGWGYLPTTATWVAALMQDLKDMIYRDRNRPSVVSFGVRINESADNNAIYGPMNDTARAIDPSRPTHGVRRGGNTSTANFLEDIYTRNFADAGATGGPYPWFTSETVGHNAGLTGLGLARSWSTDDTQFTSINMYVTEQNNLYSSASYIVGKLAWCAFDYLSPHNNATAGEKGDGTTNVSRGYMSYVSPHGLASLFRLPKLGTYLFQSQRDPILYGPMIFIANDWTGRLPTVTVFSNCDSVELFLNGVSQGKKKGTIGASLPHPGFQWALTYTAGTLKAVGYIGGVVKATHTVSTPSAPVRLVITADDASINDGGDMTRIVISLVDSSGRTIRGRADSLQMSATGAGEFIGEARSALEGGQFAFYVKTGDQFPSGTITCNASLINNTAIAAVSTTVQVVPQGTTTGIATTSPSGAVVVAKQATLHKTIIGNKFTVPANIAKGSMLSVFDVAGKLLYRTVVQQKQTIDLSKVTSAAHAVYVVKIDAATISTTK